MPEGSLGCLGVCPRCFVCGGGMKTVGRDAPGAPRASRPTKNILFVGAHSVCPCFILSEYCPRGTILLFAAWFLADIADTVGENETI